MDMGHIKNKVEGTNSVGGQVDLSKSKKEHLLTSFKIIYHLIEFLL